MTVTEHVLHGGHCQTCGGEGIILKDEGRRFILIPCPECAGEQS